MDILYLAGILAALGIVAAVIGKIQHNKDGETDVIVTDNSSCASCDGINTKCEQECMMEAAVKDIVYFDDEELDVYKGRPSDKYTDEEAGQFGEIMYTMRQEEVKEWNRSLIIRGINMPDQLKDEYIMLAEG